MRQEADDARQQLSTMRELTDKQIAKAEAAAQQEVQQYRQRWREEFERRRKLHNQVCGINGCQLPCPAQRQAGVQVYGLYQPGVSAMAWHAFWTQHSCA